MFLEFVLGSDCAVGLLHLVLDEKRPDLIIKFDGFGPFPGQLFVLIILATLLLKQALLIELELPIFVEVDELDLLLLRVSILPSDVLLALVEFGEFILVLHL